MMGISPVFEVEAPELSFDSGGTFSVAEGGTATVTVSSNVAAPAAATVAYTVTDVTATGGADYTAPSGTFALTAGATAHSFTIDTIQDTLVEGNETFTIRLNARVGYVYGSYAVGSPDTATVTITDDDMAATPEISMALQTGKTSNRNAANQLELAESGGGDGAVFNLSADGVLASALTVCLRVTEAGGDLLAASAEGIKTATLTSSDSTNGAGIYTPTWTGDADDERNSVVTATLVAPATAGCSAASGTYTVSSTMASDAVRIEDDDATAVALTSSDTQMAEGDASDTATLTVALGRRMYADEAIVVPLTLATTTGARLPGHATPDFSVTAAGAGVAIARDNTATPSLTFTGHDTNPVRTATVTLTPVANRDDGDGDHEEITATLASDSVLDSTMGSGTTVGGGAMRHGTDYAVDLRLADDEFGAAPELTFGSATYSVDEDAGTVDVTVNAAPAPGNTLTVKLSSASGTAGLNDYAKPPATFVFPANETSHTISVTVKDDGLHEDDETFTLTLGDASDASYTVGSPATTTVTIVSDDPPPPPVVSAHPLNAVGIEGAAGSASVELRLSRALESGETLTVDYSLDLNAGANQSHNGVTLSHTAGDPSTGTLTVTGPNAPQVIRLGLTPAANTVDYYVSGSRAADFRLTSVSGVAGAALSGVASAKIFVNDSGIQRSTSIQVPPVARRHFQEGEDVWIHLDGKAGKKRDGQGLKTHDGYNVVVGVQNLTTDFDDLGTAYAGRDAFVGHLRREGDTDYYNVGVLGYGWPAQMRIPISSDGVGEGEERFRVFIAETPDNISSDNVIPNNGVRTSDMGVEGTYNSLESAPGVDFIIKGHSGGPQRGESTPAPTQAVSNVQVTAVDAANAKAAWDAVEHATSYLVEYETTSALADERNHVQGAAFGWTETSWTFQHDAAEAMTITVTVTPAYEDENGDTQHLDDLAGTGTIDVAPTSPGDSTKDGEPPEDDDDDDPPPAACVSDAQWKQVSGYYDHNRNRSPNYGANWYRVLIAYQQERTEKELPDWVGATAKPTRAYTVKEAEDGEKVWSGWTPVRKVLECLEKKAGAQSSTQSSVPLLPGGWNPMREGVVQFTNRSAREADVRIVATDDSGWSPEAVTLHLGPGESVKLVTRDLEQGNVARGLVGYIGTGQGDWRLDVTSEQVVEAFAFVRARDGLLVPMDDVAEPVDGVRHVPTFLPANDPVGGAGPTSLLRLVNRGDEALVARIAGTDDTGAPGGEVTLVLPARQAVLLTAADLEGGGANLRGGLGDGQGMWRLRIASDGDLAAMSLIESPDGRLVNLSGGGWSPAPRLRGVRAVPYFPSASDAFGRQGFLRIVNHSAEDATVRVQPRDDTERRYEPLTLVLRPGEAAHLDSRDLELGNAASGLRGSTGAGTGDWRLEIATEPGVEVLAYLRTPGGSLLPMHQVAGEAGGRDGSRVEVP